MKTLLFVLLMVASNTYAEQILCRNSGKEYLINFSDELDRVPIIEEKIGGFPARILLNSRQAMGHIINFSNDCYIVHSCIHTLHFWFYCKATSGKEVQGEVNFDTNLNDPKGTFIFDQKDVTNLINCHYVSRPRPGFCWNSGVKKLGPISKRN